MTVLAILAVILTAATWPELRDRAAWFRAAND